jgi:hypothetical protein
MGHFKSKNCHFDLVADDSDFHRVSTETNAKDLAKTQKLLRERQHKIKCHDLKTHEHEIYQKWFDYRTFE